MYISEVELRGLKHAAEAFLNCLATGAKDDAQEYARAIEETIDSIISRSQGDGLFQVYYHATDSKVTLPLSFPKCVTEVHNLLSGSDTEIVLSDFSRWDEIVNAGTVLDPNLPEETTNWRYDIRPAGYTVPSDGRIVEVDGVSADSDARTDFYDFSAKEC